MPMRYLFSCFWEGQEGSTLLWLFWHALLGLILIFKAKEWEPEVLTVVALCQVFLASMLLGIYVFDYRLGSSPFILLRDAMDIPIFKMNPNYVPEDGNGLNPTLMNYWMTIHPPTLFLGFALAAVPFAYGIAALWKKEYKAWVKPILPWYLVAFAVLGIGIMMGGAWAYEALSFGGFWAWDPVENASLVPWILMAAGLHTLMAYKHRGYSLKATFLFIIFSFVAVVYSTYLTKSGDLDNSSVHSFTDMGMSWHLRVIVLFALVSSLLLYFKRAKFLPVIKDEEKISSREFWLFIGALIFLFSSIHITFVTSIPVYNKIFNTNFAPPADVEGHFNNIQIYVGIILALGMAVAQFLKYKSTNTVSWIKEVIGVTIVSLLLSVLLIYKFELHSFQWMLLCFATLMATLGNITYIFLRQKGKLLKAGGSIAHVGFGLFLLGTLISQGKQEVVSLNSMGIPYGDGFDEQSNAENVLLYKDEPQLMNNHRITYLGDSTVAPNTYFKVQYVPLDNPNKSFVLLPNIQINPKMGNVANPDTRHKWNMDLYTHITSAPINDDGSPSDTILIKDYEVGIGDTVFSSRSFSIVESLTSKTELENYELQEGDLAVGVKMKFISLDTTYYIEPIYLIQGQVARPIPVRVDEVGAKFYVTRILPEEQKIAITVEQKYPKYIIMKAIIFPYINLMWSGALIMFLGIFISAVNRRARS